MTQDGCNGRKRMRSDSEGEINGNVSKRLIVERYDKHTRVMV